jgi:hypothetical protein
VEEEQRGKKDGKTIGQMETAQNVKINGMIRKKSKVDKQVKT